MAAARQGASWAAIAGITILVLFVGSGLVMAAAVAASGVATVYVHDAEEDFTLYLPVPAALIEGGSIVASARMSDQALSRLRAELGEIGPVAVSVLSALEDAPDAVLVEVEEADTYVRVEKVGDRLEVIVDEGGSTSVRVSVPLGAVRRSAARVLG